MREQNHVNFVNSVPGPWPLFLLPVSRCLRGGHFSRSAAPLSRGAAPLVAPRSSLLVAAASSSPLASLRRWASLRLCDAALNADPHPVLMDAGLLTLFPLVAAAPLSSLFSQPHSSLTLSPLLFASPLRRLSTLCSITPLFAVLCRSAFLFAASLLSLPFSSPLRTWFVPRFLRQRITLMRGY